MSVIHCALLCCQCQLSVLCTIAKFHCTDTDTDPNRPARSQRSFAAKSPCPCPCRERVRVRVVEFSSYCPTLCSDVRHRGGMTHVASLKSERRKQEAQLSPRDRAMRLVSSNLANYHATVQKLLIRQVLTKPMVWSCRFSWGKCVINKPTTVELCISPVYRRLAVAKFSKSIM